ncbi:MAG: trigger factor [Vulcanimicrobiaceae bacterium]
MTTSTLTRLAPTKIELEIAIPPDELAAAADRAFRQLVAKVKLPGFRPGHVPRRVFEQTYGEATILDRAMEELVPEAYARAVREHDLDPVDRPQMEFLEQESGQPTRIKATVEVRPVITLGSYRGISVPRPPIVITDEDVDHSLEALARERGTLIPCDRPARLGDIVTLDYRGRIGDEPFEGGSAEQQTIELSEDRFIPGFATGIVGLQAGESREFEATFPPDYAQPELAGKVATFAVTLHDIKELEVPLLDDRFAAGLGNYEHLEALRRDVRARLEAIAQARADRQAANHLVERLLSEHQFELPSSMVEREVDHLVEEVASNAGRSGGTLESYLEDVGQTQAELRAGFVEEAERRVKGTLLIEAIAKAESIVATPADIREELESLSRRYGQPVERIRKALANSLHGLEDGIVRNKTLAFLLASSELTDAAVDAPRQLSDG